MSEMRESRFEIGTDQNLPFPTLGERWQYVERLGLETVWDRNLSDLPSRPITLRLRRLAGGVAGGAR